MFDKKIDLRDTLLESIYLGTSIYVVYKCNGLITFVRLHMANIHYQLHNYGDRGVGTLVV